MGVVIFDRRRDPVQASDGALIEDADSLRPSLERDVSVLLGRLGTAFLTGGAVDDGRECSDRFVWNRLVLKHVVCTQFFG
jgi:hypothetical protein